jgi:pyruvate dehydrogenase E2 component (dihydrolipoamide acetyltransferase)
LVVAITILVPRLGWSMEEGTFAGWLKRDGEQVRPGEPLFALESDKSTEQVESLDAGILRIPPDGPKTGDTVKVGQLLGHLVADNEVVSAPAPLPAAVAESRRRPAISPRARRLARELGIDWHGVTGSGRHGRIRERDIRSATSGPSASGRLIPHTSIRRTIAARMVAGVTQAAPVTLATQLDATNLVALRSQFKAAAADEVVPTYTDLIVKLTATALRQHPLLQAQWRDDGLFVPERIDIALAVDTEAGLLAPVLRSVDQLTPRQVAARAHELIESARAGRLTAEHMRDATFTVTNLGAFGIDAFTPIIHLPQCAVLGVGRIVRVPAVYGEQIVPRDRLTLSLTFDHRVVDGAPAARFLQTLCGCLENPAPRLIA